MQRIRNILDWQHVPAGGAVNFPSALRRRMRLDVNSPGPSQLFYCDGNGLVTFLALVTGRDVLEFEAYGEFSIQVEGNDCYFQSVDGEDISHKNDGAATFTKIWERRARNPEMELMQYMMQRNANAMMEGMRHEFEQLRAQQQRAFEAASTQSAVASDDGGPDAEPEPDGNADTGSGDKSADGGNGRKASAKKG